MKYASATLFLLLTATLLSFAERTYPRRISRIIRIVMLTLAAMFGMIVFE